MTRLRALKLYRLKFSLAAAACCAVGGVLVLPGPLRAQDAESLSVARALEQHLVEAIARAEDSVVSIARVKRPKQSSIVTPLNPFNIERDPARDFNEPGSFQFIPNEFGTGIVIALTQNPQDAVVLTNYHIVKGGPPVGETGDPSEYTLYVRFSDRRGYWASILAADPRSDLAVLQIDFSALGIRPEELKPLKMGDASDIRKGQLVLALGNPYAIAREGSASASWGMVSNIARRPAPVSSRSEVDRRTDETIHHYGTLLQVDTRLNLGTSGGALLNLDAELVGVTTSLAALEGYETSVGYAIPMDAAMRRVIDELVHGYEVEYGFLGVVPRTTSLHDVTRDGQASAAMVESVMANSPASSGGLLRGDIILKVNGATVYDHYDLMREVGGLGPGTRAQLLIRRDKTSGTGQMRYVTLGKWPASNEDEIIATNSRYPAWRGLSLDYPTGRERFTDQYSYLNAVAVAKVEPGSDAAAAGLQPGEFIRQVFDGTNQTPVSTPAEFYRAVEGLTGGVTLQMDDGRGNFRQVVIGP